MPNVDCTTRPGSRSRRSGTCSSTSPTPTSRSRSRSSASPGWPQRSTRSDSTLPEAFRHTARNTGSADKLTVYVENGTTAGWLVAGIYADADGHPGQLLAQSSTARRSPGVPGTRSASRRCSLTQRAPYWIAVQGQGGILKIRTHSGGTGTANSETGRAGRSNLPPTGGPGRCSRTTGRPPRTPAARAAAVPATTRRARCGAGLVTAGPSRRVRWLHATSTHTGRPGRGGRARRRARASARSSPIPSMAAIRLAVSMVDLTTLEGQDTPGKVAQLAAKAVCPAPTHPEMPSCAAVCVYPSRVADARRALEGTRRGRRLGVDRLPVRPDLDGAQARGDAPGRRRRRRGDRHGDPARRLPVGRRRARGHRGRAGQGGLRARPT